MEDEVNRTECWQKLVMKSYEAKPVETWRGVTRRVMAVCENLMLLKVTIQEGSMVPAHKHLNEQVGYLIEGEMKIRIGGEWYLIEAGDSYIIPSNVEHEALAVKTSTVIEVFHPPVEAFKKDVEGR
ncbi:MAG: cupin domain-containing protein [Candidatus Caldarchaeales archaeon]